jgi:FdhD protein
MPPLAAPPASSSHAAPNTGPELAEEVPVGFRYGGLPHAVMMATPDDLEDFALGFSLTEGIVGGAADIRGVSVRRGPDDIEIDIALTPVRFQAYLARERGRALRTHTSCGVCGVQEIGDLPGWTACVKPAPPPPAAAIRRALAALRDHQPLGRRTNATHAAGWADAEGALLAVREDVGRHNALDKLIGAFLRGGCGAGGGWDPVSGFCVVTSRCSFEMVQKSVAAGFSVLVALSAPTLLAVQTAEAAGLTLVTRAGRI